MVIKTVAIYVFFDDILKSMNYKEPENRRSSDAEIMTVVLIAAGYFGGNTEKSLSFVRSTDLMPLCLVKIDLTADSIRLESFSANFSSMWDKRLKS
jgi:hypothetical protein